MLPFRIESHYELPIIGAMRCGIHRGHSRRCERPRRGRRRHRRGTGTYRRRSMRSCIEVPAYPEGRYSNRNCSKRTQQCERESAFWEIRQQRWE